MNLAPIVLFVYNRSDHTKKTIESLSNNKLAIESDLIVYSDGWKNNNDKDGVVEVREYLKTISGFKSIKIYEQDNNLGLADSIMSGVTRVVNKYGKIIVLEDDIVTSPFFLSYMNDALNLYENESRVMHISGYFFPVDVSILPETFFYNQTSCWGWGTWKRSWDYFNSDIEYLLRESKKIRSKNGYFKISFSQLKANKAGRIKTWAARWQFSVSLNNGLCLHPRHSFVKNIGHDGSGSNSGDSDIYGGIKNISYNKLIPISLTESRDAVILGNSFLKKIRPNIFNRLFIRAKFVLDNLKL